jgi:hypothetical protein
MVAHLRQRVCDALASAQDVLLATSGPAQLQASRLPCEARAVTLYLLVPRASDHLYNIEVTPDIVIVNRDWEVRGRARVVPREDHPAGLGLAGRVEAGWSELVEVKVAQFHQLATSDRTAETIDVS